MFILLLTLLLGVTHALPMLPDGKLTPGVIATTDESVVCQDLYSKAVRHTSQSLKAKVYANYGLTEESCGHCEVDHRIPLSLGGADVEKNLWPQSYEMPMGAHEKDALEDRIHEMVCREHSLTLETGQNIFKGNWMTAYKNYVKE